MISAIIFDLDGTLVDSLPGLTQSLNRILELNQFPTHSEKHVRSLIGHGVVRLVEDALPASYKPSAAQIETMAQAMSEDYAQTWKEGTTTYPHVPEVLHALAEKQIPLAVFSNKPDASCREMVTFFLPDIPFVAVRGQRAGCPVKPHPQGALAVAEALNLPPSQIAFVGDSTIDLATAKNAGMIDIAASWGYHDLPALQAENPTHLIQTIDELKPLVFSHIS